MCSRVSKPSGQLAAAWLDSGVGTGGDGGSEAAGLRPRKRQVLGGIDAVAALVAGCEERRAGVGAAERQFLGMEED